MSTDEAISDDVLQKAYKLTGPTALILLVGAFAYPSLSGWEGIAVIIQLILAFVLAGVATFTINKWWLLLCGLSLAVLIVLARAVAT